MSDDYGKYIDYMEWVKDDAKIRKEKVEQTLKLAFSKFIEKREIEVIVFDNINAVVLSKAIIKYPLVLKPLLAVCNIAARSIERDLLIKSLDTYEPKLNKDQAKIIAGYIKPYLPAYIELPALSQIDRLNFIDKEIRKRKGNWEKNVIKYLNKCSKFEFKKRRFICEGEKFELDAANPEIGEVRIGIDIKRIEARKDIHKRCDEIANKALKLKSIYPKSFFATIIYYPFIDEHINIQIPIILTVLSSQPNQLNRLKMLLNC
jgi:hypothetical protein